MEMCSQLAFLGLFSLNPVLDAHDAALDDGVVLAPDYVPGPEHPPLPDFVPEPVYPEFMPPKDELLQLIAQPHASCCLTYYESTRDTTIRDTTTLPIPLPTSSLPLLLPSTDCREDVLEVTLPPQKRLCIAPGPRYEVGESLYAPTRGFRADYHFTQMAALQSQQTPARDPTYPDVPEEAGCSS
ncbi:hypothetical protein Tco_1508893 [Tanacetum coccineum]